MAEEFDGRCMTCRETVHVTGGVYRVTSNKRGSVAGPCPECGKTVFKLVTLRKKVKKVKA